MHIAFKAGCIASTWGIVNFFIALYYLFKNSPAQRDDFLKELEGALPKTFIQHGWLENVQASEYAINLLPSIKKYIVSVVKFLLNIITNQITVCTLAPFPFPQLQELRDSYTYNIQPFTSSWSSDAESQIFSGEPDDEDEDLNTAKWYFSNELQWYRKKGIFLMLIIQFSLS
ncbi:hypothetical protein AVEN_65988-1 [Araneus ventricosus]|uniref:Uncharacterized protein n=1 Tax=Araneus ventricosus TaxID=182803 RepID=A0A4Y2QP53_ARAVE|nr:hypothetical protein AVEN_65988-1 [Araneus ventricosus]